METIFEVIRHVFLGSSCAVENADLLREHNVTYLLGASNNYNLKGRRTGWNLVLSCKNVHVKDTVLEVVEECNDYIHFCRKNGFNVLVHSPKSLPLSSLLIALYLKTVSNKSLTDTVQLLRRFRPDHDLDMYRREWTHFGSAGGPCQAERRRLGEAWGEREPALSHFDFAILTQLQMEAMRMTRQLSRQHQVQTCDSREEQLLTSKALEEFRRSLLVDTAVKEEAQRRQMKERRREEMYQLVYVPDYKLTYDCHEFDESIFHNARLVDFYLPSSIDSMLHRLQTSSLCLQLPHGFPNLLPADLSTG